MSATKESGNPRELEEREEVGRGGAPAPKESGVPCLPPDMALWLERKVRASYIHNHLLKFLSR